MPSHEANLFDKSIFHIRHEAETACNLANSLTNSSNKVQAEVSDLFDLKRSATNLRQAADYLDDIRRKLDQQSREENAS